MRIAHAPGQIERQPRAVAIGTFDGVHRGHLSVIQAAVDSGLAPTVITFDPHPRVAFGNEVELITTLERRLELFAELGVESTLVAPFTPGADGAPARDVRRALPRARSARPRSRPARTSASAPSGAGDRDLLGELGFEILDVVPDPRCVVVGDPHRPPARRQPRAVAIGTFDGVHRGHLQRDPGGDRLRARADRDHVRSASTRRIRQRGRADHDSRAPVGAVRRAGCGVDPRSAVHDRADGARARDVRRALPQRDRCRGDRGRAELPLRRQAARGSASCSARLGFEVLEVETVPGVSSSAIRTALRRGRCRRSGTLLGRPFELDGVVVAGDQRGGTLGYPTANLAVEPRLACPAYGIYAGSALGHRAAVSIGTNPHYGGTRAADRALPARLRRRSLRQAARRRGVGAAARRRRLRLRGGARRPDRPGRRRDARRTRARPAADPDAARAA